MHKIITFSTDALLEEWVARFWMTYSGNASLENDQITYSDGSTVHLVSVQNLETASTKVAGRTYDEGEHDGKLTPEIAKWVDEVVSPAMHERPKAIPSHMLISADSITRLSGIAHSSGAEPWLSTSIEFILRNLEPVK